MVSSRQFPKWSFKLSIALALLLFVYDINFSYVEGTNVDHAAEITLMKARATDVLYIRIASVTPEKFNHDHDVKLYYNVQGYVTNVIRSSSSLQQLNDIGFRTFSYADSHKSHGAGPIKLEENKCVLAYFNAVRDDSRDGRHSHNLKKSTSRPVYVLGAEDESFTFINEDVDDDLCNVFVEPRHEKGSAFSRRRELKGHPTVRSWIFGAMESIWKFFT